MSTTTDSVQPKNEEKSESLFKKERKKKRKDCYPEMTVEQLREKLKPYFSRLHILKKHELVEVLKRYEKEEERKKKVKITKVKPGSEDDSKPEKRKAKSPASAQRKKSKCMERVEKAGEVIKAVAGDAKDVAIAAVAIAECVDKVKA